MVKENHQVIFDSTSYQGVSGEIELSENGAIASWQRLQYGMFIHWGVYSEYAGERNGRPIKIGYSEQIQMWDNIPETEYLEVAKHFTAAEFDPKAICDLAKSAGMNYIVITSKHHDGFVMFDTATTDYNIVKQTPYGKDTLKQLAEECEKQGLKFGVYFSLVDWHQGHDFDENNNNTIPESMEPLIEQQLRELMTNYGPIAEVWFDMSSPTSEQSVKFSNIVHDLQPGAVVNSRIWNNRGDFRTLADNQVPLNTLDNAWQTPASIYHETWGYRRWQERTNFDGKVRDLIAGLTSVQARGGNYLLNIGPRGDGSVVGFERDVLLAMGEWLNRHEKAIIGADATRFGGQSWGEITLNGNHLFLHVMNMPEDRKIILNGLATNVRQVVDNATSQPLEWNLAGNQLIVKCPERSMDAIQPVIRVELEDELRIIPEQTVETDAEGQWTITPAHLQAGYGFSDRGNYNTLKETIIRRTAFIATEQEGEVRVKFQGKVVDKDTKYLIELGKASETVTGEQLMKEAIGPFTIDAHQVTALTIRLAEPDYKEAALNLELDGVTVELVN